MALFLPRNNSIWKAVSSSQGACNDDMIGAEAIAEFLINSEETKVVSIIVCFKNGLYSAEL